VRDLLDAGRGAFRLDYTCISGKRSSSGGLRTKRGQTLVKEIMPDVNVPYQELERALGMELMCSLFSVLDRLLSLPRDVVDSSTKSSKRGRN